MMRTVCRALLSLAVFVLFNTTADAQYRDLLSNRSLQHWMTESGQVAGDGWSFDKDGSLHLNGRGGNIISRQQYGDFELWFEFRISGKANSGVKYRVRDYSGRLLGCEFQILDDDAYPMLNRKHLTASLYDIFEPRPDRIRTAPVGEFNVGKIEVRGHRIRHWVNGQLTIDERTDTRRWREHIANSKFSNHAGFGENRSGHIMLTDHNSEAWYRNVFIRCR